MLLFVFIAFIIAVLATIILAKTTRRYSSVGPPRPRPKPRSPQFSNFTAHFSQTNSFKSYERMYSNGLISAKTMLDMLNKRQARKLDDYSLGDIALSVHYSLDHTNSLCTSIESCISNLNEKFFEGLPDKDNIIFLDEMRDYFTEEHERSIDRIDRALNMGKLFLMYHDRIVDNLIPPENSDDMEAYKESRLYTNVGRIKQDMKLLRERKNRLIREERGIGVEEEESTPISKEGEVVITSSQVSRAKQIMDKVVTEKMLEASKGGI